LAAAPRFVAASFIEPRSGQPIGEPVVGKGPFVMNTQEEIRQAYSEYQSGAMGRIG
jgi:hypothetical protein